MLPKRYRLKAKKDFRRVYQKGKTLAYPCFVLYRRGSRLPEHRVGFSISKKVGNAVERNRIKRRLRELARSMPEAFSPHADYIFVVRAAAKNATFDVLAVQMREALKRLS